MATDYDPRPAAGPVRRAPGPLAALALLAGVVGVTGAMGAWQLSRAHQKEALQARHDARAMLPPLSARELPRSAAEAANLVDRRVVLAGRWLPDRAVLLDNRPMDGHTGFDVVMPLRVDGGPVVVVQRGWIARDATDPRRIPPFGTPEGGVHVEGHIAPPPSRWFQLGADVPGRIRQNLDLPAMQRDAGAPELPYVVVQDASGPPPDDGLSRHWPAPAVTADRNYGYAVQWFAMSAAAVAIYLWLQFLRPRRGRATPSS